MFWCYSMQYAATGRRWYTAGIVQMSYQRALFYFAQLSRMIFSVHLASTRGSTSEILQHDRDLTILSSPGRYSGTWVIGADMRRKLSVALQLAVPHHFIMRIASGLARGVEHSGAFGATKTPKTFFVDPYKPAGHLSLMRQFVT